MKTTDYIHDTKQFVSIIDFLRFGLTCLNKSDIYYGHGTDNAYDEVYALILGSLSLPFDIAENWLQASLSEDEKTLLAQRLQRRIEDRVPVPYLTHKAYFCGLPFYVDERVLIPRSPLGEWIERQFVPWIEPEGIHHILDLCTGSACIAIACCYAFPGAKVDAVDISKDALKVAQINQKQHELHDQLTLIESNLFENVPVQAYDIIVSNPPYVCHDEMKTLPEEYRHEPVLALEASSNGLAIVDQILEKAAAYLSENGVLIVEVGNSEAALVEAYPDVPFTWLEFERGGQGVFLLTRQQLVEHFGIN